MVKDESTPDASGRKRKRRNIGTFPCSKCQKVFTRSDHLARHYLNHQPKEVYVCNHIITDHKGDKKTCGKTFVRKDLQERHLRRHTFLQDSKIPDDGRDIQTRPGLVQVKTEAPQLDAQLPPRMAPTNELSSSEILTPPPLSTQTLPRPLAPVMAFPPPPENPPIRPLQLHQEQYPAEPGLYSESTESLPQLKHMHSKPYRSQFEHIGRPDPLARLHPVGHHNPLSRDQEQLSTPNDQYSRHDSLTYYGMHTPVNSKRESRNYSAYPQSQNDILSWLFTESPTDPRNSELYTLEPLRPQGQYSHEVKNQLPPGDNSNSSVSNPVPDSLINMGLQDLNFFSNGNNPLDMAVFDATDLSLPRHERSIFSLPTSTGSSNSPSTTTDSFTPATIAEGPLLDLDASAVSKKLDLHLKRNCPSNTQFFVNHAIVDKLVGSLPQISRELMSEIFFAKNAKFSVEDRLSFYLFKYWEAFHPRFSIIHRVSFDTMNSQPLLILSMIMIGCMYSTSLEENRNTYEMSPEFKLSTLIAIPLRFAVFQHEDFKSPVKLWVLQTLNLLEWCEKNYLARDMHERAHIHHGTTVQLLRRSPFLGGNPAVTNMAVTSASDTCGEEETSDGNCDVEESSNADFALFQKWVQSESMKRVTFMTFYVDILDYVKFRHNPQIPFYQLQLLNLPCHEEQLWDSEDVNGSFRKLVKRQRKLQRSRDTRSLKSHSKLKPGMNFLTAMKLVIRSQNFLDGNFKISEFCRSIFLGGLVSIMHEMQQVELQRKFTSLMSPDRQEWSQNQIWKNILTKVFDDWDLSHSSGSCSEFPHNSHQSQCLFPMYHLIQIVGFCDINHYDIAIFAGSPRNMSVEASQQDFQIVQKKLQSIWGNDGKLQTVDELINAKSVIHCYWLLWEHLLTPLNQNGELISNHFAYSWSMGRNSLGTLYVVSVATLVLWCNVFSVCGMESESFADSEETILQQELRDYDKLLAFSVEDGYRYLFRVQGQFIDCLRRQGTLEGHVLHAQGKRSQAIPLHSVMQKYCENLPLIQARQNISGLCFLVGTQLLKCQWPIIRENAKLIINCGLRSVGKKAVQCPDLFN